MKDFKRKTIIEFILVFGLLAASFLINLEKSKFRADESMWINQSSHFEDFFTGNFSVFEQKKSLYLAYTMPTIPEYVIGLSRAIGGYNKNQLNNLWDWNKTLIENEANGNLPSKELLWWARFLPSLLSIASIIITYYLIKTAFNDSTGYFWLVLTIMNSWLVYALSGAMGESPLLFNIVIAMLTGFWALKSFRDDQKGIRDSLFWLTIFGVFTGLAGQSKMNGLAIFATGIVLLVLLASRCSPNWRWKFLAIGFAGLSITTFICYIGTNPFLWDDPIGKTIKTYTFRIEIMHGIQAKAFPSIVIKTWQSGLQIALERIFKDLASFTFTGARYINMLLACFGSVVLLIATRATLTSKIFSPTQAGVLSILLVGFFASSPNLFTPLNIDRYYMLPAYFVSILIALGIDSFIKYISQIKLRNQILQTEA